jgi:hypothetical protein
MGRVAIFAAWRTIFSMENQSLPLSARRNMAGLFFIKNLFSSEKGDKKLKLYRHKRRNGTEAKG